MDIAILSEAISHILQCATTFLPPPATRLSSDDIRNFEDSLKRILHIVKKAMHSYIQDASVLSLWLKKVKDVINDLNDFMEDLRHNKETNTAVLSLIKASQNMARRHKFKHQIKEATEKLIRLLQEAEKFVISEEARENERKLTRISEEFENVEVVGRENVKKDIIDQLKLFVNSIAVSVPVITIVGVAGIGKTKLARLVYGDEEVKALFASRIWVNRETFNVESIATHVTETANNGKRFLLVLDDLRVENGEGCLEMLQDKLTEAEAGGAVVVTTRSNLVANKIAESGTVKLKPCVLQGLNQEESWYLFQKIQGPGLRKIKEDVERRVVGEYCGGVPMKIIAIARLLEDFDSPVSEIELKEKFLRKIRFTYYDELSTQQKLCFAYCSLFPQEHEIDAGRLIHLWMAEGFLSRNLYSDPEEFGLACFNDFVPFVFQEMGSDDFCVVKRYKMNRLMHELARTVAWERIS
ncbi:hypothetical protein PHAVU_002G135650 [Phaseolus vulgaris]